MKKYYDILEISENATMEEVKKAHRRLVKSEDGIDFFLNVFYIFLSFLIVRYYDSLVSFLEDNKVRIIKWSTTHHLNSIEF